ncbi:MAG: VOC family protein [Planctomycetota bacterium]
MSELDDYFEYAMDLNGPQRKQLLKRLRKEEPALAKQLQKALDDQVKNPDFLCQEPPVEVDESAPERLHHVTLQVADVPRAIEWYQRTFRCRLDRFSKERAVLHFDGLELHLVSSRQTPPSLTLVRPDVAKMGPSHRRSDGVRVLNLVDPWGNAIELVDRDGTPGGS